MAGEDRPEAGALVERLQKAPYKFDFFQAVRQMECAHPDLPRVGTSQHSSEDPLRFGQEPSLGFAPSSLSAFIPGQNEAPPRLMVNFCGLLGPHGPLPLHITEYARDRLRNHGDETLSRFFDLFNHRMVSLFYRAWSASQLAVSYDRPEEDRFAAYIGGFAGIGMESFRRRDAVPDVAKQHYAGRLSSYTHNAEGLEAIIEDYFKITTQIEQFVGHWIQLPNDSVWRLGESPWTGSLGTTAVIGAQIWDCQQKFRITMGPMSYDDYKRMLPGSPSFDRLAAWVRNYVGDEFSWDVKLILTAGEVPQISLGVHGKLGWTTWVKSGSFQQNVTTIVSGTF